MRAHNGFILCRINLRISGSTYSFIINSSAICFAFSIYILGNDPAIVRSSNNAPLFAVGKFIMFLCLKKCHYTSCRYSFDVRETIFIFFGAEMLPRKQTIKRRFHFPPDLNSASALSGKTGNSEIGSFSFKCCMLLLLILPTNTHQNIKYYLLKPNPPFTVKMIDCVHQTETAASRPHARRVPSLSRCRSLCQQEGQHPLTGQRAPISGGT